MATLQPLSPLDWLMPRSYIRQLLFFRAPPAAWADRLQAGLARAVAAMPHLAGAVVDQTDPPGSVALLVGPSPVDADALFSCQDCTDILDYDVLRGAHFPPSALRGADHALFDPVTTTGGGDDGGKPVFRARLTHMRGGAVLALAVHHATTDITGLGALLGVWAAHCRGGDNAGGFAPEWCDRAPLCGGPPATPDPDGPPPRVPALLFFEDEDATARTPVPRRFPGAPGAPCAAGLFAFAAPRLRALRDGAARAATTTTPSPSPPPWLSTGDVLTAVLYSAVFDALHGDDDEATTADWAEIAVPVNVRTRADVPLPAGYLGAAFGRARVRVPVRALRDVVRRFAEEGGPDEEEKGGEGEAGRGIEPPPAPAALDRALAPVARAVRRAIAEARGGPEATAAPVATALAFIAQQTDVSSLRNRPARALSLVSWADEGVHTLTWDHGAHTRCEAVRGPDPLPAGRNYVIVLPRRPDGALDVLVGLERAAMARFVGAGALVPGLAAVRWVEDVV